MAVSESGRHELYRKLEGVIGRKPMETMMPLLPPVGGQMSPPGAFFRRWRNASMPRLEAMESRINERTAEQR